MQSFQIQNLLLSFLTLHDYNLLLVISSYFGEKFNSVVEYVHIISASVVFTQPQTFHLCKINKII